MINFIAEEWLIGGVMLYKDTRINVRTIFIAY